MTKNILVKDLSDIVGLTKNEIVRFSRIFSDKIGVINAILKRYELQKYNLVIFQSLSASTQVLFGLNREVSSGGLGVDHSERRAFLACIGEAIERYCMSFVDESDLFFGLWKDIPKKCRVDEFHLYSAIQYKRNLNFFNPKKSRIYWVRLRNFLNLQKCIYWPASLIYLPFKYGKPVAEATSTGTATGPSVKKAIISGL